MAEPGVEQLVLHGIPASDFADDLRVILTPSRVLEHGLHFSVIFGFDVSRHGDGVDGATHATEIVRDRWVEALAFSDRLIGDVMKWR